MRQLACLAIVCTSLAARAGDDLVALTPTGALMRGEASLSQRELYELAGRTDLMQRSDAARSRRNWLLLGAGASVLALVVPGIIVYATTPNLASPYCESSVERYNNECLPQVQLHQNLGGGLLVSGLVAGTLLTAFAVWSSPDLLSRRDLEAFVDGYNQSVRARPGVQLLPVAGPDLLGVVLRGTY